MSEIELPSQNYEERRFSNERRQTARRMSDPNVQRLVELVTEALGGLNGLSHSIHDLKQSLQRLPELEAHQEAVEDLLQTIVENTAKAEKS